jgi:hypothetical protein
VRLDRVELVYVYVFDGASSYYEPAYRFGGTQTLPGAPDQPVVILASALSSAQLR